MTPENIFPLAQAIAAGLGFAGGLAFILGGLRQIAAAPDALCALQGLRALSGPGAAAILTGAALAALDPSDWAATLALWGRLLLLGLAIGLVGPALSQVLADAARADGMAAQGEDRPQP